MDWRVSAIGHRVGFTDEKHFLKVFKASAGSPSSEYPRIKRMNDGGETK